MHLLYVSKSSKASLKREAFILLVIILLSLETDTEWIRFQGDAFILDYVVYSYFKELNTSYQGEFIIANIR